MTLRLLLIILLSATTGFALANVVMRPSEPPPISTPREVRSAYFEQLDGKGDVVIVGDSVSSGILWAEALSEFDILNRAISGDSTENVLARIEALKRIDADLYVIMLGINDLGRGRTVEETAANMRSIVDQLPGVKMVLEVTPCSPIYDDCDQQSVDLLNRELSQMPGVTFVETDLDPSADLADMVHPNASGMMKLAALVADAIAQAQTDPPTE